RRLRRPAAALSSPAAVGVGRARARRERLARAAPPPAQHPGKARVVRADSRRVALRGGAGGSGGATPMSRPDLQETLQELSRPIESFGFDGTCVQGQGST